MATISPQAHIISVVLEKLTDSNIQASRKARPTALDGQFYAEFGLDHASIGDDENFDRLKTLATEITNAPEVASRIAQLKSKGMSVEFAIYDEPSGHSLCILIKDHALYDAAYKKFEIAVARHRGFLPWVIAWLRAKLSI